MMAGAAGTVAAMIDTSRPDIQRVGVVGCGQTIGQQGANNFVGVDIILGAAQRLYVKTLLHRH